MRVDMHAGKLVMKIKQNGGKVFKLDKVSVKRFRAKTMDFLPLAFAYTVVFIVISYVVLVGGSSFHQGGFIAWFRNVLIKINNFCLSVCEKVLPRFVVRAFDAVIDYLFFSRNRCMLFLYVFLITVGGAIYTVKISPFFESNNKYFIATYVLIGIDVLLFIICNRKNPGIITQDNARDYVNMYTYDGLYYTSSVCKTCGTDKPARSKHCSLCNVCVSRFDHHCSWVNNCIGVHNYKYFLAFIFTSAVLCIYATFITVIVFAYIIISEGLATRQYVGSDGNPYPVTARHICQYLLVTYPIIFTLFMVVLILSIFLFAFCFFHFYLTLTNQTTNELYKRWRAKPDKQTKEPTSRIGKIIRRKMQDNNLGKKSVLYSKTPYYISLWSNVREVLDL